ncbi:DNA-binding LacI/PurR family transcriptional regulator [Amycolatopsis lexingtonensis]|uniref:DNA-binding LacI/PurR family transcriptional regulator n=1 Tax=Amycolatopsis lexingtonensis TaxID=218822 RepID=A0ABR9IEZ7_9PSEU|nr:LacI family DNA-binding transcriptional regulator [Amycolatopsis lexingtonensis]MBE1501765.1 DNA-binding LacI/PurR family transcriptional regulator [Amycolatopsis lexingtonensis]
MGRPTLNSVAEAAAVSRQTVSNVINSPEVVSPETRERVLAAIERLGYRPNTAARQMRTTRSQIIGLCIPPSGNGVSGVVLDQFLHSLTATAERYDHRIMLFTAADDEAETRAYADLIASVGIDGFVLTNTHHDDLRTRWLLERELPFVTFGRPWGAEDTHPWVDVDGAAGTRLATDHLVRQGHRRIAFVGWPEGSGSGDDRRAGWAAGLAAAGLGEGPQAAVYDGVEGGRSAAARLLDAGGGGSPTAFVCASDSLALGVTAELRERGIRPGADAAVIGFDDTPTAAVLGLSSVAQPIADVAAECVRQLRTILRGQAEPATTLFTPHLVLRTT